MSGVMTEIAGDNNAWAIPNDRHLFLKAQLKAGWSVRSQSDMVPQGTKRIDPDEQDIIKQVLDRARETQEKEEQRIGKLVDRLQNIKRRALGNGTTQCLLCGTEFGLFGPRGVAARCFECTKYVCQRSCGVDTVTEAGQIIFLCKICSEEREMWKKTGAWFYNGVPTHELPSEGSAGSTPPRHRGEQQQNHVPSDQSLHHSSSRRRLPNIAHHGGSSRASTRRHPQSTPEDIPSTKQHFRPRWVEESNFRSSRKQRTESDSDSSSDGGFRINRRICRNTHFQTESEPESEASTSGSPVSSRHESVASASPSATREEFLHNTDRRATDTSDNHSIDSGVAQSDRSLGALSGSTSATVQSSSSSHMLQTKNAVHGQSRNVRPSLSTADIKRAAAASPTATERRSSDIAGGSQTAKENEPATVEAPSSIARPVLTEAPSTSSSSLGVAQKPTTLENLPIIQKSSFDVEEHLSSSPDDELSSLGTLEFTLHYDSKGMTLTIHVIKAENLRAMDANGFSDPYIKVHMLPGANKSTQLRTKTVNKSLNPEWDEKLVYYGVVEEEMHKKTLRFTVFDEDRFGHDFLGETRVPLKRLVAGHERKYNVYLEKQMPVEKGDEATQERGKILISLLYVSSKSVLVVGIIRCAELIGMDQSGYSDPYVRIHLKPDKKLKFKTPVKKRTCNPEFNCEFNIPCSLDELSAKSLEVTVFDRDVARSDDYIGGVQFTSDAKGERLRHWMDCLKNPNQRSERWHKLSEETF